MRAHQGSLHCARKIADLKWLPEHRGPIYEVLRYILVRVARRENHRQLRVRALLRQSPPARSCRASRSRPSASPDCRPSTRRCDVAGANGSYGSGLAPVSSRSIAVCGRRKAKNRPVCRGAAKPLTTVCCAGNKNPSQASVKARAFYRMHRYQPASPTLPTVAIVLRAQAHRRRGP